MSSVQSFNLTAVTAGSGAAWANFIALTRISGHAYATGAIRASILSAATACIFNIAGRLGLLPRPVARAWWCAVAIPCMLTSRVTCEFFNVLGRVLGWSDDKRCGMCNWGFTLGMGMWEALCGHMTLKMDAESRALYAALPTDRASVVLVNHSTFLDALMLPVASPHAVRARVRILYMAKMLQWPIMGPCLSLCGHFPVFFSKYAEGNFKVDERQAAVSADMESFLHRNTGVLMLFPEGTLNKDPEGELLPFRTGVFRTLTKMQVDVYTLTFDGTHRSWPRDAVVGGIPATIGASFRKFETKYFEGESPEVMAVRARAAMHAQLHELIDERLGKTKKNAA